MSITSAGNSRVLAVIPARLASTRLREKMILPIAGKPLVFHTYERARSAELVSHAVIATDSEKVLEALAPFDADVIMTSPDHVCGTDRVAEVAKDSDAEIIVNVQGDEPLIDPKCIDEAIRPLLDDPKLPMSTLRRKLEDSERVDDPNVVKVVCDTNGFALYFSRSPIPHVRDGADWATATHWEHIGLYVYRKEFLLEHAQKAATALETAEKLEQLRVLESGHRIRVVETQCESISVDTPEDLERVRDMINNDKKGKA